MKNRENSEQELSLTKTATTPEIETYFQKVLTLKQSGEEFPVNLDDVWPLVYNHKRDAVESLKKDFIENIDYQVLRQNTQNPIGGRPTDEYKLSVSCMEFFIARKVRPVFEVYRQVFHRVVNTTKNDKPDASRNILPGVHSPEARMIGEHAIWTICIDNTLFYSLKDILNAAGMYEHKRKETSKNWFRSYVYWINDRTGTCPKRYINEAGVLFLFSRTRANKGDPRARQFLASFTRQAERNKLITAMPGDPRLKRTNGDIDLEEFLNVIISTQESENRKFLYDLYNKLLTIRQPWKN